jgi:hypothetical protein
VSATITSTLGPTFGFTSGDALYIGGGAYQISDQEIYGGDYQGCSPHLVEINGQGASAGNNMPEILILDGIHIEDGENSTYGCTGYNAGGVYIADSHDVTIRGISFSGSSANWNSGSGSTAIQIGGTNTYNLHFYTVYNSNWSTTYANSITNPTPLTDVNIGEMHFGGVGKSSKTVGKVYFDGDSNLNVLPFNKIFSGQTAGAATCSETFQMAGLKVVSCYLNAYQQTGSAQTWTYPTAFASTPVIQQSGGSCGTYNPSSTASTLTLPANAAMTAETCQIIAMGQ